MWFHALILTAGSVVEQAAKVQLRVVAEPSASPVRAYVALRDPATHAVVLESLLSSDGEVEGRVAPGEYALQCGAEGFVPVGFLGAPPVVKVVSGRQNFQECRLQRAVPVSGVVLSTVTGKPLPGARVYLAPVVDDGRLSEKGREFFLQTLGATADRQGRFQLYLPPKSRLVLEGAGEGTARVRWPVRVPEEGGFLGQFALPQGGELVFTLPEGAQALGTIRLRLRPLPAQRELEAPFGPRLWPQMFVRAGQTVSWADVPVGFYVLEAFSEHQAGEPLWRAPLEVGAGTRTSVTVPLVPWVITGTVAGIDPKLHPCRVKATSSAGHWEASPVTAGEEKNHFSLSVPWQGPVRLSLVCQGLGEWEHTFPETVAPGRGTQVQVELEVPGGAFYGWVRDKERPIPGAEVTVVDRVGWHPAPGSTSCSSETDGEGFFRCPGIGGGRAVVFVRAGERFYGPKVEESGAKLEPTPGRTVRVRVSDENGEPLGEKLLEDEHGLIFRAALSCWDTPALVATSAPVSTRGEAVLPPAPRCPAVVTVWSTSGRWALGFALVPEGGDASVGIRLAPAAPAALPPAVSESFLKRCSSGSFAWRFGGGKRFPVPEWFSFLTRYPPWPGFPLVLWPAPAGQGLRLEVVDWEGALCWSATVPASPAPEEPFVPGSPLAGATLLSPSR